MSSAGASSVREDLSLKYRERLSGDLNSPLIFLVHGRAGNSEVMWGFRSCIPQNFSIISPEAPLEDPLGGYSWWMVENASRDTIQSGYLRLESFIEDCLKEKKLQPSVIVALGFSQGAGILSLLLQRRPSDFGGVGLLAGFVIRDESSKPTSQDTDVFMAHGTKDEAVPLSKAKEGAEYLKNLGFELKFVSDEVGHKVGREGTRALKEWLSNFAQSDPS